MENIMAAEIRLFTCLTDNFGYLIHDPATKATASIDAPEAGPIIKALVNPLVNWIWIGVLIVIAGTGVALVPNAAQIKSPVPVVVAAPALDKTRVHATTGVSE